MNEKQKQIKIAQERLSESESEIISHIIVCELDDIDNETFVYNEEEVKNNICLLISIEDILEEEHVSLEKAIYKYVINCGEVSFDSEDTVKEIINHCIKNRKRIYCRKGLFGGYCSKTCLYHAKERRYSRRHKKSI